MDVTDKSMRSDSTAFCSIDELMKNEVKFFVPLMLVQPAVF